MSTQRKWDGGDPMLESGPPTLGRGSAPAETPTPKPPEIGNRAAIFVSLFALILGVTIGGVGQVLISFVAGQNCECPDDE